jgi:SIR2-like domain
MRGLAETLEDHYDYVGDALRRGRVVPLLGAGVNLCDPSRRQWCLGENLPDTDELSRYIAEACNYPGADPGELLRVAQYVQAMRGDGTLYDHLHDVFAATYGYTSVHAFLARLPAALEAAGGIRRHQLIVTTNYDDALEQALIAAGEQFDLVWYESRDRASQGRFVHQPPGGEPRVIESPRKYRLPVAEQTVVLKIHGAVSREDFERDSYVISEDDYIRFLMRTRLHDLIPATLLSTLFNSHILFLGYSLRDWNLRVILHQIATQRDLGRDSWAIQKDVEEIDRTLWNSRDVHLHEVALDSYIAELSARMFGERS